MRQYQFGKKKLGVLRSHMEHIGLKVIRHLFDRFDHNGATGCSVCHADILSNFPKPKDQTGKIPSKVYMVGNWNCLEVDV